jgi:hypothetical protein
VRIANGHAAGAGSLIGWMRRRRSVLGVVAVFAVVAWAKPMGLLLWARIRILTSIPKTAIADEPLVAAASAAPIEIETGLPIGPSASLDPFRVDPTVFPMTPAPASPSESVREPLKQSADPAETMRLEQQVAARRAADRFRLGSAGAGLSMALIDGRMHRIGDSIESPDGMRFTLVEIRDGSVLLERGGENFELRLVK